MHNTSLTYSHTTDFARSFLGTPQFVRALALKKGSFSSERKEREREKGRERIKQTSVRLVRSSSKQERDERSSQFKREKVVFRPAKSKRDS